MKKVLHKKSDQEIKDCIEAQEKFCKETGAPYFAPPDGRCYRCGRNIYQFYGHDGFGVIERRSGYRKWTEHGLISCHDGEEYDEITGYSNEEAVTEVITGCSHCNTSYCD